MTNAQHTTTSIPSEVAKSIDNIVSAYTDEGFAELLANFVAQVERPIRKSRLLANYVHSVKARTKAPEHLRRKLVRKYNASQTSGKSFDIDHKNFPVRITDLAGVRVLHLHTKQFEKIDVSLRDIFKEYKLKLFEKPFARTWDDEYRDYFRSLGIRTEKSKSMYTSVHYVVSSASETTLTCEIQVRTLMEEVWGEVDHQINYPDTHSSVSIREQLRTLARSTSAATRLVDCIFTCEKELGRTKKETSD